MDKIVPVEAKMPHEVYEAMCWKCGKRWIAVVPTGVALTALECPQCHEQGYAFKTGQEIEDEG